MKFKLDESKFKEFNPVYQIANDCYLIAFCACFGIPYEEAKRSGISSDLRTIKKIFQQKGYKYNQVATAFKDTKLNVEEFAQKHPFGTYYVVTFSNTDKKLGHAVALIDGTIYDGGQHPDYYNYYVDGYFEIKKISSNLDTSYIDDPNYFSDFAINYALNKFNIDDMDTNTKIKATRSGSNSLQLKIGNKNIELDFPLNASKEENEKMIKKAIDRVI